MTETVVITGASAGIGHAIAETMVDAGYDVVNLDRTHGDTPGVRSIEVDLVDRAGLQNILDDLASNANVVALVNNAGFARTRLMEDTDDDVLDRTFDLNLRCAAQCARTLVGPMKRGGYGRIVNIASRAALGRELRTAYAASKGGLISMTRVWALELARHGITTNCVAPGPVATELFEAMNPSGSERREELVRGIPVGRVGVPRDIANAVRFFLSPDSGFVNGQTLYVCGGLSVGMAPL